MAKRRRRTRTAHPGVYLQERAGGGATRARFVAPDTGKVTYKTLDASLSTEEQRRDWAIRLSKSLARRRVELDAGDPVRTRTAVGDVVTDFYRVKGGELAGTTLERRRVGIGRFEAWCQARGVQIVESITPAQLADLRSWIVMGGRFAAAKGGKRGARVASSAVRRPATVNTDLTSVKILLNHLRAHGKVPKLNRDAISDHLKALKVEEDPPEYLQPAQIRELLTAAQKHDAATFVETRNEHAGHAEKGKTLKYADAPITPFVLFLLFTGCRRGEALGLEWGDVDLEAVDQNGKVVGEINLRGAKTKTRRGRKIGLEVSPMLREMLAERRRASTGDGRVFAGYTDEIVDGARERMVDEFKAPAFTWHMLRATCATYLTCSTGIWGAATVFLSARQLGHSVAIAEKHYLGTHRGVPREAKTLEAAMGIVV